MVRNNMAMSFVILAILTSSAAAGEDNFCATLFKAVGESKTGFFNFRSRASANTPYDWEQRQSGWSTPFRLPNSEFCFIDDVSRPSLVCNYPATSIDSMVSVVQGCLSSDWTMSSRKRFTKGGSPGPPNDDDRIVFTNRTLERDQV
jgi:hypothetical protein